MAITTLQEKQLTSKNNKAQLISARVIANYGDPGLDEDGHFDILSRFVIVALESTDRIPTADKWTQMIAVVARPKTLWIDVVGSVTNPHDQQRQDNFGNTNSGPCSNYSVNAIPRINQPYYMGETIFLRKLDNPWNITNTQQSSIFKSQFTSISGQTYYNNWHTAGSDLPYIQNGNHQSDLKLKTIQLANNSNVTTYYSPQLNKYQYEAFALENNTNNTDKIAGLIQIFLGQWQGYGRVYDANGGYFFGNSNTLVIPTIEFEDSNSGQKMRVGQNSCLPLVVVSPSDYIIPKSRSSGTINFSPTIVPIGQ
jgi:hypothetical protein